MLHGFRFSDRREAGRLLAQRLDHYAGQPDTIILALPRGGVPVAYEIAIALHLPLDVFMVRKLGVPGNEELAMGAVASGGVRVTNNEVLEMFAIPQRELDRVTSRQREVIDDRERLYRDDRPPAGLHDKTVILVDDGLATGSTFRAAIAALRQHRPVRVVAAAPVGAREVCESISNEVDEVVCAASPDSFFAVGEWYDDFSEVEDDEVRELLREASTQAL
jgi:predicted phosphoribosyltransferase